MTFIHGAFYLFHSQVLPGKPAKEFEAGGDRDRDCEGQELHGNQHSAFFKQFDKDILHAQCMVHDIPR